VFPTINDVSANCLGTGKGSAPIASLLMQKCALCVRVPYPWLFLFPWFCRLCFPQESQHPGVASNGLEGSTRSGTALPDPPPPQGIHARHHL
jgi:hypothetical protein